MMEARTGERHLQAKECWDRLQPPAAGDAGGTDPWHLQKECHSANTLFLTSALQHSERTNVCCFKPPDCGNLSQQAQETPIPSKLGWSLQRTPHAPDAGWHFLRGFHIDDIRILTGLELTGL